MRRRGWVWAGLAISAVLLAWTLRGLHLEELGRVLREVELPWLGIGAIFYFVAVALRTWRWGVLLRGLGVADFRARFVALTIGYMGNNLYPARAGELLRAYVLRRRAGIPVSALLGAIVVERVLDGLMMLVLAALAFPFAPLPEPLRPAAAAGGLLFGGAFFGLILIAWRFEAIRAKLEATVRRRPHLLGERGVEMLARFAEGLAVLRGPSAVLAAAELTALIWLAEAGTYGLVLMAFPFRVPFFALLVMTAAVNLATAVPSAPGYLGPFEAAGVAVLRAFGTPASVAFAYTLTLHLVLWLPITLVGFLLLLREGLRALPSEGMAAPSAWSEGPR